MHVYRRRQLELESFEGYHAIVAVSSAYLTDHGMMEGCLKLWSKLKMKNKGNCYAAV
jgi:hypothetical protein